MLRKLTFAKKTTKYRIIATAAFSYESMKWTANWHLVVMWLLVHVMIS